MSIYILLDYVELSKENGNAPSWKGLEEYKSKYWRD